MRVASPLELLSHRRLTRPSPASALTLTRRLGWRPALRAGRAHPEREGRARRVRSWVARLAGRSDLTLSVGIATVPIRCS